MSYTYGGYGSSGGGYGSSGSGYGGTYSSPFSSAEAYGQFTSLRAAHGVLASIALALLFPVGAIIIRLLPSKWAVAIHAAFQATAYLLFTVAFGIGIYIARSVNFGSFKLINQAHPIIGIVVWVFLTFQPILGIIHHRYFKKYKRRTVWTYAHLWLGRIVITLGIVNGALGLSLANNSQGGLVAYSIIAALIWLVWMGAAVYGELKRRRTRKAPEHPPAYQQQAVPLGPQPSRPYHQGGPSSAMSNPSYGVPLNTQGSGAWQNPPDYYGKA